jgi:hypothetical protein
MDNGLIQALGRNQVLFVALPEDGLLRPATTFPALR